MIDAICTLIGITGLVVVVSTAVVCWRRGFGAARTLFWLRAVLIFGNLWSVVSVGTGWLVAINALALLVLCPAHLIACRRLSAIRACSEDSLVGLTQGGQIVSISFDDACFSVAAGWRS